MLPVLGLAARWIGGRALTALFGTATRAAVTTVTADSLTGGHLMKGAASGIGSLFKSAVLPTDENGNTDWTTLGGMGAAVAIGTTVLSGTIGTPLALLASTAVALYFNDQIGDMAHTVAQAVGREDKPQAAPAPAPAP